MRKMRAFLENFFYSKRELFLLLACICVPLRLSWTYIVLLPPLILWLTLFPGEVAKTFRSLKPVSSVFLSLLVIAIVTSIFGIDPTRSIFELVRFGFVSFTALYITALVPDGQTMKYAGILCLAQALASLHSISDSALRDALPRFFHGTVTESGQLALTIPLAFGILFSFYKKHRQTQSAFVAGFLLLLNTALLCVAGFSFRLSLPTYTLFVSLTLVTVLYIGCVMLHSRGAFAIDNLLSGIILPLLLAALVVNLKRGPWSGVFAASFLFLVFQSWRVFLPLLTLAGASLFALEPIRERLLYSPEHFFISGGRGEIWRVGAELIERYPLGIGFHNSSFMHNFSVEIPPELVHFHSNFINVLVETGWIGFFLYLACLTLLFKIVLKYSEDPIAFSAGLSLFAWQVAGIVEYNIGDSEVFILAMVLTGILFHRIQSLQMAKKDLEHADSTPIGDSIEPDEEKQVLGMK